MYLLKTKRYNKTNKLVILDTLDIVCHSMGFAYAQGMISEIQKAGIKVGKYYIIAPENANSGSVNLNDFEEVWQYGSDLGLPNADPKWLQDGIAPQTDVQNINNDPNKAARVSIPKTEPDSNKGFIESHSIENYKWIFNLDDEGKVKKRD